MANVLLTQRCVRSCPYCFAKKHMANSGEEEYLSWPDLIYLADLFDSAGNRHMSLLGGEPTLHPRFVDFLLYLLARDFHITVFTSGILNDATFEELNQMYHHVPNDRLGFVCNINDPKKTPSPEAEQGKVTRFLQAFGSKTAPSFNIYRMDFDLGFLVEYINRYGLIRNIRLGLAHPIVGHENSYISPNCIDRVVERLFSFVPLLERFRIQLGFDCGFPLCKFRDDQLGVLNRLSQGPPRFSCGPPIDIGPDMMVWACFPLSFLQKRSVFEFDSLKDITEFYEDMFRKIRGEVGGIYDECDDCLYREGRRCDGGCVAHILSRFQDEARVRVPEIYQ